MRKATDIILGTGSYDTVKSGNKVSISGDGGKSCGYEGQDYRRLAPRLETFNPYAEKRKELNELKKDLTRVKEYQQFRKQIEDEYIESFYNLRLKKLDVEDLLEKLNRKHGKDIILLCYEPIEEFCHRRLVADFIELKTGIYIPEVSVDEEGNVEKLIPIRYKKRLNKVMTKSWYN